MKSRVLASNLWLALHAGWLGVGSVYHELAETRAALLFGILGPHTRSLKTLGLALSLPLLWRPSFHLQRVNALRRQMDGSGVLLEQELEGSSSSGGGSGSSSCSSGAGQGD